MAMEGRSILIRCPVFSAPQLLQDREGIWVWGARSRNWVEKELKTRKEPRDRRRGRGAETGNSKVRMRGRGGSQARGAWEAMARGRMSV